MKLYPIVNKLATKSNETFAYLCRLRRWKTHFCTTPLQLLKSPSTSPQPDIIGPFSIHATFHGAWKPFLRPNPPPSHTHTLSWVPPFLHKSLVFARLSSLSSTRLFLKLTLKRLLVVVCGVGVDVHHKFMNTTTRFFTTCNVRRTRMNSFKILSASMLQLNFLRFYIWIRAHSAKPKSKHSRQSSFFSAVFSSIVSSIYLSDFNHWLFR